MKISEVAALDVKMASQVINILQAGELTLTGKEFCAAADTIRWFQKFAVSLAEGYQATEVSPKAPASDSGFKVKSYSPGKVSK